MSVLDDLRQDVLAIVMEKGVRRLEQPVQLASGAFSRDFVDCKQALARGDDLALACRAMTELAAAAGIGFDAVGGMTMGADCLAHGMAVLSGCSWFVVRKAPKGRGTNKRIEGASLTPGQRVLLVEDVATSGGSIHEALQVVVAEAGPTVSGALTLVDRAGQAAAIFSGLGIPYLSLLDYNDLGIEPVGSTVSDSTSATPS